MTLASLLRTHPRALPGLLAKLLSVLMPLVLLAACGDLPQPFLGNPGATARVLAQPPTPRLAIPAPGQALLSDQAAVSFAVALADALQQREVPAVAAPAQSGDWRLEVSAAVHGATVIPTYTVIDPKGQDHGKAEGAALPTADWAAAVPATLSRAATEAAPGIADLLTHIQAALQQADPNSLYNRPARVQLVPVIGAPGDGNLALTKQMRTMLARLGPMVQDTATGADFILRGTVRMVPITGGQERVEIQWSLATPTGDERGRVIQLNDVPAGSLNGYWGDVATAVAQEAAAGVRDVILRQSGRTPQAASAGTSPGSSTGSSTGASPGTSTGAAPGVGATTSQGATSATAKPTTPGAARSGLPPSR
jgi:hypothetical protein